MNTETFTRIKYFDILRLLAISMVILLHIVSGITDTIPEQMTHENYIVYTIIKHLMAVGVPLFLMISGALFLNTNKTLSIRSLFQKYIRRIILAIIIFGTTYSFLELIASERTINFNIILLSLKNMIEGNSWAHMWYLYALLGLYLFLPLTRAICKALNKTMFQYVLLLMFWVSSVLPFLEKIFPLKQGIIFPIVGIYLFYYLAGYYFHYLYDLKNNKVLYKLLFISIVAILIFDINGLQNTINYENPFIVITSICVFLIVKNQNISVNIATKLTPYYFGMYLIHPLFLNISRLLNNYFKEIEESILTAFFIPRIFSTFNIKYFFLIFIN